MVSRIEIDKKETSYTIDTLNRFQDIFKEKVTLYFITGADAILEILTWKNPKEVTNLYKFIAATRPGYDISKIEDLKKNLYNDPAHAKDHIFLMEIPALAISSTDIRKRIRLKKPIKYLLPEGVVNYLLKHGLYS